VALQRLNAVNLHDTVSQDDAEKSHSSSVLLLKTSGNYTTKGITKLKIKKTEFIIMKFSGGLSRKALRPQCW